ncbi:MAG: hypothetical protein AAFQ21_07810 [Pseudomonadota bacterium]
MSNAWYAPAVRASRKEPPDSLEFYPTPPWATRALLEYVLALEGELVAWEPASGEGDMARPLGEYFHTVYRSDVFDYGRGGHVFDGLEPRPAHFERPDWIITIPPFKIAKAFAERALLEATEGVAMFVRTQWMESIERFHFFCSSTATDLGGF